MPIRSIRVIERSKRTGRACLHVGGVREEEAEAFRGGVMEVASDLRTTLVVDRCPNRTEVHFLRDTRPEEGDGKTMRDALSAIIAKFGTQDLRAEEQK